MVMDGGGRRLGMSSRREDKSLSWKRWKKKED